MSEQEEIGKPPGCLKAIGMFAGGIAIAMLVLVGLVIFTCRF
jgi:hypothetical protein